MSSKQRSHVPTLPSGTVTFLFTDIEGSTRLWETQREAMTTALERHDALLRQCIESHGGHIFKTVGDAFCAAFATAPSGGGSTRQSAPEWRYTRGPRKCAMAIISARRSTTWRVFLRSATADKHC